MEKLKEEVCAANLSLKKNNLITLTWGNVSAISDDGKFVVIKPSGVDYGKMTAAMMTVCDLDGKRVEGELNPSSDLYTHLEIYKNFSGVRSVVHTHSRWATATAQAETDIPCYGTTHADNFYGTIPLTRKLTDGEISKDYELNTGKVIVETFKTRNIDPIKIPAVLVCKHGPFSWGESTVKAVENAIVLEESAYMAFIAKILTGGFVEPASQALLDKHYYRKHGENSYYGQKRDKL
ncbi:MAG: L-ribulose-5-phosphate 4-epimerase AraD [Clostridia bacterium]|nr:L-ribulose-5-phosphate 4-epimerase AraD [Clostridia bacterium]